MAIEIKRASHLGPLHQTLGIDPASRISLAVDFDGSQIDIWDLATGRYIMMKPMDSPIRMSERTMSVPQWVNEIIQTPTDELLKQYNSSLSEGDGERRITMFTELCYRGVSVLGIPT